ncbi:MAG: phosphoglycerate dehydrogenase [Chloroflexota bacterium]
MSGAERVAVCSRSFSTNPVLRGELLARYERVTFNDAGLKLAGQSLADFLQGHEKAIIGLEPVDGFVLGQLPELTVVSKYGVGLDMIDLVAMRAHGKRLGWTGGVNRRSVSELSISFMIAMLRHVPRADREVRAGMWRQHVGGYLTARTIGIIGCGHVGQDLVTLLQPFGCHILVNDIRDYPEFFGRWGVETCALDDLLRRSDIVTLHVPLDDSTRGMMNAGRLALMKPSALLINTARGGLVDEAALASMLREQTLAGAAFDVFAVEPLTESALMSLPNFLATPHIGGSAAEAILAMGRAAIEGLDRNELVG